MKTDYILMHYHTNKYSNICFVAGNYLKGVSRSLTKGDAQAALISFMSLRLVCIHAPTLKFHRDHSCQLST